MFDLLLFQATALIVGVALFEGGARLRRPMLAFAALFAVYGGLQYGSGDDGLIIQASAVVQGLGAAVFCWLAWTRRDGWLALIAGLDLASCLLWANTHQGGNFHHMTWQIALLSPDLAKAACLASITVRDVFRSPRTPPAPERDVDLFQAAMVRWPRAFGRALAKAG